MDSKQGVCLFYQRTGTCKLGDQCPLSHVREERGITTKYDDRIWQHAQVAPGFSRRLFSFLRQYVVLHNQKLSSSGDS